MPKQIIDEFTFLDISRQRKYQLRKHKQGKCVTCGAPANGYRRRARKESTQPFYCEQHRQLNNAIAREGMRKRLNLKTRWTNSESYSFESG